MVFQWSKAGMRGAEKTYETLRLIVLGGRIEGADRIPASALLREDIVRVTNSHVASTVPVDWGRIGNAGE